MLQPQSTTKIPLGFQLKPPDNTYAQIMSRSSLAIQGITCYGGVIDPDFCGELCLLLHNSTDKSHLVTKGDCIAQLIFIYYSTPAIQPTDKLDSTIQGDGAFGSTNNPQHHTNATIRIITSDTQKPSSTPISDLNFVPTDAVTIDQKIPYNIILSNDP
jgi:dUTP pyrophosphatase